MAYSAVAQRNEALALELLEEHRLILRSSQARFSICVRWSRRSTAWLAPFVFFRFPFFIRLFLSMDLYLTVCVQFESSG